MFLFGGIVLRGFWRQDCVYSSGFPGNFCVHSLLILSLSVSSAQASPLSVLSSVVVCLSATHYNAYLSLYLIISSCPAVSRALGTPVPASPISLRYTRPSYKTALRHLPLLIHLPALYLYLSHHRLSASVHCYYSASVCSPALRCNEKKTSHLIQMYTRISVSHTETAYHA